MPSPTYTTVSHRIDLSVVVPAFNEQDSVVPLWRETRDVLRQTGCTFEVIFVDDGSTDKTLTRLRAEAADDARLVVVKLARNFGQSAAMAAGARVARGRIIAFLDGDGQNDPSEIPRMLEHIEAQIDSKAVESSCSPRPVVVCGWRRDRQDAALRSWFSHCANVLISRTTGVKLHDYGCTLKLFPAAVLKAVPLYGELHRFIPVFAHAAGARIVEMPVNHRPRRTGTTKYGLDRTFRVILDLATVRLLTGYRAAPMRFFGGWAWRFIGGAAVMGLVAGAGWLGGATGLAGVACVSAVVVASCAVSLVGIGLLAELLTHIQMTQFGRLPYDIAEITNESEVVIVRADDDESDATQSVRGRRAAGSRHDEPAAIP